MKAGSTEPAFLCHLTATEELILFLTNLLAIPLTSECLFYALLFTWFQVERVTLYFFDDVFGLHFALETAQGILERFTFLNSNLCQRKYTSQSGQNGYFTRIRHSLCFAAHNSDKIKLNSWIPKGLLAGECKVGDI